MVGAGKRNNEAISAINDQVNICKSTSLPNVWVGLFVQNCYFFHIVNCLIIVFFLTLSIVYDTKSKYGLVSKQTLDFIVKHFITS